MRNMLALVAVSLALIACTTEPIQLPAVTQSSSVASLPGKVIWHDLISDAPAASRQFYGELFGWTFEPVSGVNYELIRNRGELIGGMVDQNQLPVEPDISQWVAIFAVADADTAAGRIRAADGDVLTPPTEVGLRGRMAVATDTGGALLGLLETRGGDPQDSDKAPPPGAFLWDELWATDVKAAERFYAALASFEFDVLRLQPADGQSGVDYRVFSSQEQRRFGIRDNPVAGMAQSWLSYLRVEDSRALATVLSRVPALGGDILLPATDRSGGLGQLAIISDPSGAVIGLQTWGDATGPYDEVARDER